MDYIYVIAACPVALVVYLLARLHCCWQTTSRRMRCAQIVVLVMLALWSGYIIKRAHRYWRIQTLHKQYTPVVEFAIQRAIDDPNLSQEEKIEMERLIREALARIIIEEVDLGH